MKNTFIHIGFPKTGSTFIQTQLFTNLREFRYLTPPYTQHDELWNKMQYGDDTQFDIKLFQKHVNVNGDKYQNILVSDEGLVGKPIYAGMHRSVICERLKQTFPNAKILIVIRGQFDMLKSLHNQWVKGARKGTKTFGDFIWAKKQEYEPQGRFTLNNMYFNTNEDYVHLDFLDYMKIIQLYKDNFEEVKVIPYELMNSDINQYISEITDFLNVKVDINSLDKTKRNLRLNSKILAKQIAANSLHNLPISLVESKLLMNRCASAIHKKNELEYNSNRNLINTYYKKCNADIINRYPEIGIQNYPNDYAV